MEIFDQQPTKRTPTASTEPPLPRVTIEDFVTSSQILKVLPSNDLPKHINVYTSPCYRKFQAVYQHNIDQSSKSTCSSNLFLAQQPILYNTSQQQTAAYHPSVSYRQESDLARATTYQPLRSHRQALDKPTFDSEHPVPYRQETDHLYRSTHQTPVLNGQINEELRPNTHANSQSSCDYPTTIYQRPSVSFRRGTDNPQMVPSTFNLAELLSFNKWDSLPEWKLSCFD